MSFTNIKTFPMSKVENLDAYCVNAMEKDVDYLIAFDTDKLLAGFRETAGLDTKGVERYEGWESTLIGGHTLGHFLSAIAQAYDNPGVDKSNKDILYKMITDLVDGLLECQANSKGKEKFLFGAVIVDPDNVEKQFDNIEENKTNIMTEAWVPWYTLHKILAGVIDAYKLTGYEPALTLAKGIGDWSFNRAKGWDEETAAQVIRVEYGGMNEVLYELFVLTGDEKYAWVAHTFDSVELFERVASGSENTLNNHHANTTIPKFIGALNRYNACHGKSVEGKKIDAIRYKEYAESFWDTVVKKHTYVTGGNSEWEHFGKDYILDKERTNCNCETCNIYNMLKFSRTLFCNTGDVKYLEFYENAFYNTILSSQNPETGMTTYFQPMSTGYFKVFGQRFNKFWCCTGTGMENFTKLNDSIFYHDDDNVIVSLYEKSRLEWEEKNAIVEMDADLVHSDKVTITVKSTDGKALGIGIALRIPAWADGARLVVNGEAKAIDVVSGFVVVDKGLESGSVIELTLPMKVTACPLADNERSVAFKYGPFVLSADLGCDNMETTTTGVIVTIPAGKVSGYDDIVLPDDISPEVFIDNADRYLVKDGEAAGLKFDMDICGLSFAPHYSRYKERYGIYFTVKTKQEVEDEKAAKKELGEDISDMTVIDTVQPGYGQYEIDELHRMFDWGGSVGSTECGTTRYAKAGGSFTYHMCVNKDKANYLAMTFMKEDNGKSMKIMSGDDTFFEYRLDYDGDEDTYDVYTAIPKEIVDRAEEVVANSEKHTVIPLTFKGMEGAQSARLFGFVHMGTK